MTKHVGFPDLSDVCARRVTRCAECQSYDTNTRKRISSCRAFCVQAPFGAPALKQVRQLYSPAASDMHFVRDMSFGRDMRYAR